MGTEAFTRSDLKLFALAPDAGGETNFRLPTTWGFGDPHAYLQAVMLPR